MRLIKIEGRKGYEKLHNLPFNRQFSVRPELTDSIKKYGFINPVLLVETDVVDGKMKTWIADGQNRALSAAYLDITFYGIVVQQEFKEVSELVSFVAQLNSTQKSWSCTDYAEAYNYLSHPEYHKLLVTKNKYTYSTETVAAMMTSRTMGMRAQAPRLIKSGKFVASLMKEVDDTMEMAKVLSRHKKITSRMLLALHQVRGQHNFNDEVFINNFLNNQDLVWETKEENYMNLFKGFVKSNAKIIENKD